MTRRRQAARESSNWLAGAVFLSVLLGIAGIATAASSDLRVSRVTWVESSALQADGRLQAGESGRAAIRLWNRGAAPVGPITGQLTISATPGVALDSSASAWPALARWTRRGSSAEDTGGFALTPRRPRSRAPVPSRNPSPSDCRRAGCRLIHLARCRQPTPAWIPPTDIGFQIRQRLQPGVEWSVLWSDMDS